MRRLLPHRHFSMLKHPRHLAHTPLTPRLFTLLGLSVFSEQELDRAFKRIDINQDGRINVKDIQLLVSSTPDISPEDTEECTSALITSLKVDNKDDISYNEFKINLTTLGEKIDYRVYSVATSMVFAGISVGIIAPVMPLLTLELGISPSQFGVIVGSFGLSKLLGNVPAALAVESYGRKPLLVFGPLLLALGMGGCGLATDVSHLVLCRMITGIGVAGFVTAATMMISDVSTPLNRTRSLAPIFTGFSVGATLGPAIGGFLAGSVGISSTFFIVGGCFSSLMLFNQFTLSETGGSSTTTSSPGLSRTISQWRALLSNPALAQVYMLNSMYWMALSGAQMTLLPLLLVGDKFSLSAYALGSVFAGMSVISVFGAQPLASLADRFGKRLSITGGVVLVGASVMALPLCPSITTMAVPLATLALGSTILGSAPVAYVSDLSTVADRAQALALLRVVGDVGLLVGAATAGMCADLTSIDSAIHTSGGVLLGAALWFSLRKAVKTS